jgi:hypothetical protein
MARRRVSFEDLFNNNADNITLRRRLIIAGNQYEIDDDVTVLLPPNPETFFYIVNPLRVGDTLDGWMPIE